MLVVFSLLHVVVSPYLPVSASGELLDLEGFDWLPFLRVIVAFILGFLLRVGMGGGGGGGGGKGGRGGNKID